MLTDNANKRLLSADADETQDLTAPFYEQEFFDTICQALRWQDLRARVPVCLKKTLHSRYMLANLVYLTYAIGILIVDFNPNLDGTSNLESSEVTTIKLVNATTPISILDQPVSRKPIVNEIFVGLAVLHLISASLYLWAWRGRAWGDIIMIPEYLNHIEAGLYLWSAIWYFKEDTLGGSYTLAVHKIELTASIVELIASLGWIMSWYMTYTRTLGRGFTFDDPDFIAYCTTTTSSIIYVIYNIQINVHPEEYNTNILYKYGDILYFIGACYYVLAALRDDHWFWFLPLAGQYGVAAGRIHVSTKKLPKCGKSVVYITDLCKFNSERRKPSLIQEQSIELENDGTAPLLGRK